MSKEIVIKQEGLSKIKVSKSKFFDHIILLTQINTDIGIEKSSIPVLISALTELSKEK